MPSHPAEFSGPSERAVEPVRATPYPSLELVYPAIPRETQRDRSVDVPLPAAAIDAELTAVKAGYQSSNVPAQSAATLQSKNSTAPQAGSSASVANVVATSSMPSSPAKLTTRDDTIAERDTSRIELAIVLADLRSTDSLEITPVEPLTARVALDKLLADLRLDEPVQEHAKLSVPDPELRLIGYDSVVDRTEDLLQTDPHRLMGATMMAREFVVRDATSIWCSVDTVPTERRTPRLPESPPSAPRNQPVEKVMDGPTKVPGWDEAATRALDDCRRPEGGSGSLLVDYEQGLGRVSQVLPEVAKNWGKLLDTGTDLIQNWLNSSTGDKRAEFLAQPEGVLMVAALAAHWPRFSRLSRVAAEDRRQRAHAKEYMARVASSVTRPDNWALRKQLAAESAEQIEEDGLRRGVIDPALSAYMQDAIPNHPDFVLAQRKLADKGFVTDGYPQVTIFDPDNPRWTQLLKDHKIKIPEGSDGFYEEDLVFLAMDVAVEFLKGRTADIDSRFTAVHEVGHHWTKDITKPFHGTRSIGAIWQERVADIIAESGFAHGVSRHGYRDLTKLHGCLDRYGVGQRLTQYLLEQDMGKIMLYLAAELGLDNMLRLMLMKATLVSKDNKSPNEYFGGLADVIYRIEKQLSWRIK